MICNMVFNTITHTPEGYQTCCFHNKEIIENQTSQEFWNCDEMKAMRKGLIEGKPVGQCQECIKFHKTLEGTQSLPPPSVFFKSIADIPLEIDESIEDHYELQMSRDMVVEHAPYRPTIAILNISNKCNLACRTCSPYLSDTQAALRRKAGFEVTNKYCKKSVDSFIEETNTTESLREVIVVGGEPMIDPVFVELLKKLRKDLVLRVQCNGTVFNKDFMDEAAKFKRVFIGFSIDGGKEINELMRTGVKQSEMHLTIKKTISYGWSIRKDIVFGFTSVLSNVTAFGLKELTEELVVTYGEKLWNSNQLFFGFIVLNYPKYFRVSNLPKHERVRLLKKLQADRVWYNEMIKLNRCGGFMSQMRGVAEGIVKLLKAYDFVPEEYEEFKSFNRRYDDFIGGDTNKIIEVKMLD